MNTEDFDKKYALSDEDRKLIAEQKATWIRIEAEKKAKLGTWSSTEGAKKKAGVREFLAFTWPFLWEGGWEIKLTTFFTFIMLILSRVMTVFHPLILRTIIINITCQDAKANGV